MKTLLTIFTLTFFFFGITTETFSQDVIILKTGEELKTKVEVVDIDIVKYKKFENQSGPTYSLEKSKIFMIKYENGSKDVFETQVEVKKETAISEIVVNTPPVEIQQPLSYINKSINQNGRYLSSVEIRTVMSDFPAALSSYNSGKTFKFIGGFFEGVSYANILFAYLSYKDGNDLGKMLNLSGFIGNSILSIIFKGIGTRKIKDSVELYNLKIINNISYNLDFKPNEIGLIVYF